MPMPLRACKWAPTNRYATRKALVGRVRRRRSVLRTRRRAERPDDDELFASDAADDTNGCRGRAAAEPTSQQSVNTAAQPWQCARTNAFEPAALCRVPALLRPFALALVIQPRSGGTGLGSAAGLRPLVPSGPAIKAARSGATRRQRTTRIRMIAVINPKVSVSGCVGLLLGRSCHRTGEYGTGK